MINQHEAGLLRGGMCERLKQAVLKTAVPERAPGVRIPLPPPNSLIDREYVGFPPANRNIRQASYAIQQKEWSQHPGRALWIRKGTDPRF
jgi:hypothetical protein